MNTTHTRRKFATAVVGAVIAVLAAILLTQSTPVAHAEPFKLGASENPVAISFGQNTKLIHVWWTFDPHPVSNGPQGHLTIFEEDVIGGVPMSQLVADMHSWPGQGGYNLQVTRGKTYRVEFRDTSTVQGELLGALTITTTGDIGSTIAPRPPRIDSTIAPQPPAIRVQ